MHFLYLFLKRLFDMGCALLGLIVLFPLGLIVMLGIELSDPGPVLYLAKRTTKNNRIFNMFKFRSMRQGKANESVFRGEEDRIFPFGRFIRATKHLYGDRIESEEEYVRDVLPTRLTLDLVYLDKRGVGFDLKMIWWTVVCIACQIAHRTPERIFGTLLRWAAEKKEEPVCPAN